MLVLTRQIGQKIVIGIPPDAVVVTVCRIDGDQVRIGIEARRDVPVHRMEIRREIDRAGAAGEA